MQRMQRPNMGALVQAMQYLGGHKREAFIAYGTLVIASIAQLAVPELTQNMIDAVTRGYLGSINPAIPDALTTDEAETLLINAALIIVLFAVIRGLFSFVQAYMAERVSQGIAFDFRNEIFSKVQRLSFSYHDQNQTGQLMVRATDDVEKVRLFIAQGLVLTAQSFLLLVITLIILFLSNWKLTLTILPTLPFALVLFMTFGNLAQPLFAKVQRRISELNTVLQEAIAGIKVVKAFAREDYVEERFEKAANDVWAQQLQVSRVFATLFPLIFLLAQIGQVVILYFGGRSIISGELTVGEYQKFSLYLLYVFFPLGQLGFIISLMAQASASAERIFEILEAENDVTNKPDAIELPDIKGHVRFNDVTFRYFEHSDNVLSSVSFDALPGETIALLGSTGSGKTTIINLIPRFYDVSEGAVLIDDMDVRDVTMESLRAQIGIVLQETNLFSGTIGENIAFGRPEASQEEIEAAAKAAAAHEFIMSFPDGYATPVGERGTTLSGGQKQRVAIARALLLDPRLLIMDDSTSSVDMLTERQIQNALDQLMLGRTSFVIAQRISTVKNADKIIVLDKGEIVAMGTHTDLLENSPDYAEIYHSQLIDDAATNEEVA